MTNWLGIAPGLASILARVIDPKISKTDTSFWLFNMALVGIVEIIIALNLAQVYFNIPTFLHCGSIDASGRSFGILALVLALGYSKVRSRILFC